MYYSFYALLGILSALFTSIFAIIPIALYVLGAIGLYTMAKNAGITYAWFAWIPFLQAFLLGDLIGNRMWGMDAANWVLLVTPLVTFLLAMTGFGVFLAIPISIAYAVFYYMVLYRLFKIYRSQSATLYTVLSILFSFLIPIWFFIIRNDEPDFTELSA